MENFVQVYGDLCNVLRVSNLTVDTNKVEYMNFWRQTFRVVGWKHQNHISEYWVTHILFLVNSYLNTENEHHIYHLNLCYMFYNMWPRQSYLKL